MRVGEGGGWLLRASESLKNDLAAAAPLKAAGFAFGGVLTAGSSSVDEAIGAGVGSTGAGGTILAGGGCVTFDSVVGGFTCGGNAVALVENLRRERSAG
jgi:hypothetical protein